MRSTLEEAISLRRVIQLDYEPGVRFIEPHALGFSSKGDLLLRAYQTGGASASGEHAWWKLFRVDRIRSAHITNDNFVGPRPLYNPDDSAMKGGIIIRL
jgi:predicted DNA-binding transcriptional regulator YafY